MEITKELCKKYIDCIIEYLKDNPIVIEKYYADDYLDNEVAQQLWGELKDGNYSIDDYIGSSVDYIIESEVYLKNQSIEDAEEEYGVSYGEIQESCKMLGVDFIYDIDELLDLYVTVDYDIFSWVGKYMAYYPVGEVQFNAISSYLHSLVVSNDVVKWVNLAGYSLKEFIEYMTKNFYEDDWGYFMDTNEVTTIQDLYKRYPDTKISPKKICRLEGIVDVLTNSPYGGTLYFGGYVDKDHFKALYNDWVGEMDVLTMGCQDFWNGSGYFLGTLSGLKFPIEDGEEYVEIDWAGNGAGIGATFGISDW